jgi:hypothetical protein
MRQARQSAEVEEDGAVSALPQRAQDGLGRTGNSVQQRSQIGAEESCGRGEPQRVHRSGRRAQLRASRGLRSTRATARQRETSDGGTASVSELESWRKTHLTWDHTGIRAPMRPVYPDPRRESMRFRGNFAQARLKAAKLAKILARPLGYT